MPISISGTIERTLPYDTSPLPYLEGNDLTAAGRESPPLLHPKRSKFIHDFLIGIQVIRDQGKPPGIELRRLFLYPEVFSSGTTPRWNDRQGLPPGRRRNI